MSLLRHRALDTQWMTPAYGGSAGAGSSGSSYSVTLASAPVEGDMIFITAAGAQSRTITDINGDISPWFNSTEQGIAYAWKISDGTEGVNYTVTMNNTQSGVCLIHLFKNIQEVTPTVVSQPFTTTTTVTSPTYTLPTPGLIIVGHYTIVSNTTWTDIPSGFTTEIPNGYNRVCYKLRPFAETGTATWSSASNSNTGAIVVFIFKAKRRS